MMRKVLAILPLLAIPARLAAAADGDQTEVDLKLGK